MECLNILSISAEDLHIESLTFYFWFFFESVKRFHNIEIFASSYFSNTNIKIHLASLASSSESEDGGCTLPPHKKPRLSPPDLPDMALHANAASPEGLRKRRSPATTMKNCQLSNAFSLSPPYSITNSETKESLCKNFASGVSCPKLMSKCDKDIVRIIGQHLQGLGFK